VTDKKISISIDQLIFRKQASLFPKIKDGTVFNIDNNKHVYECLPTWMISEGSCDTEDQSNDAENSALPSQN